MTALPTISIVTPTYNQGRFIEETIQSVIAQNYPNLEYVIIDGGSTDETLEIIKRYEKHLKFWISEKDSGQANAINKGFRYCTGEIFNWLNSDDYIEPGALKVIAEAFSASCDLVAGKVRLFEGEDKTEKLVEFVQHANLSAKGLMCWSKGIQFVQPGVWMRRELFLKSGGIDERFHYSFDWELYIRYLSLFPNVKYISKLLIHFRYHDKSKTISMQEKFREEELKIIEKLSIQNFDKKLRQIAIAKFEEKKLFQVLTENIKNTENSKIDRISAIVKRINFSNLKLLRAIGGAIKQIILPAKQNS